MNRSETNKKTVWARIVLSCLLLAAVGLNALPAHGATLPVTVLLDDERQSYQDAQPVLNGSTVFLPLRELFETLEAEIQWDPESQTITAVREDAEIQLTVGKQYAYANGMITLLSDAPYLDGGRVMIPLRFAAESLGLTVEWNGNRNTVNLYTERPDEFLTYEQAMAWGVRYDNNSQTVQINADKVTDQSKRLNYTWGSYDPATLQARKELDLAEKWFEMQIGLVEEQAANSVKNQMDEISLAKAQLENAKETLTYLEYKESMDKLKYEYGVISFVEYQNTVSKREEGESTIAQLEQSLNGAYIKLNGALRLNSDERRELEFNLQYEPVAEDALTAILKECKAVDPYLWYVRQDQDLKEFNLLTYDYNVHYYGQGLSYTMSELNLSEAKKNATQTENKLIEVINSRYNQLQQLERAIDSAYQKLADAERNITTVRTQFDNGLLTRADVWEAELFIPQIVLQIQELQLQHSQLKVLFEQYYLAPEYMTS